MDELSPLFQEIEFHERFRGYDPEEVDAYVDRVAKAASLAQGRLAELQRRVEAAEARAAEVRPESSGVSETEETLRRTLVLAQRTADAAVAEAREEAASLIADAEAKAQTATTMADSRAEAQLRDAEARAGRMLAEAETDRRALVAEAEAAAGAAADEARIRLEAEVHDLGRTRDFLRDDIDILERHLREQRARLVSSVATLSDLLDAPDALRVAPAPETSGVEIAPPAPAIESEDSAPVVDEGPATQLHQVVEVDLDDEAAEVDEPAPAPTVEPAAEVPDPHVLTPEPVVAEPEPDPAPVLEPEPEPEPVAVEPEPEVVDEPTEIAASEDEPRWADPVDAPSSVEEQVIDLVAEEAESGPTESPTAAPRFTTAADLAGDPSPAPTTEASTGSVPVLQETALFDAAAEEDPFLSQLRDAVSSDEVVVGDVEVDDEAMSAFFDDEADDDANRSWFGRRR